jgi:hypothetical protein
MSIIVIAVGSHSALYAALMRNLSHARSSYNRALVSPLHECVTDTNSGIGATVCRSYRAPGDKNAIFILE